MLSKKLSELSKAKGHLDEVQIDQDMWQRFEVSDLHVNHYVRHVTERSLFFKPVPGCHKEWCVPLGEGKRCRKCYWSTKKCAHGCEFQEPQAPEDAGAGVARAYSYAAGRVGP